MNLIKRIACMVCVLSLSFVAFVGCSFFELNVMTQRNQVLVLKDGKTWIRAGEVIDAFNDYGQNMLANGMSVPEALNEIVDYTINRKIIMGVIEEDDSITLSDNDLKQARRSSFDYIEGAILQYEDIVRVERDRVFSIGKTPEQENTVSSDSETPRQYNPYVSAIEWNGVGFVTVNNLEKNIGFVPTLDEWTVPVSDQDITNEAVKRVARLLRNRYKGIVDTKFGRLENATDINIIRFELNRIYQLHKDNALMSRFQQKYEMGANVEDAFILTKYRQLVAEQFKQWQTGQITAESFRSQVMQNGLKDLYYFDKDALNGEEFFGIYHILIKMDDEQNDRINEKKDVISGGFLTEQDYETFRQGEVAKIKANEYALKDEFGEYLTDETAGQLVQTDTPKFATQILNELIALEGTEDFANTFRDYIYMYGEDPGMFGDSGNFGYIMSSVKENNMMIKEFTEEVLALHAKGQDQIVSRKLVLTEYESGKYGVHIIFFDRKIDFINIVNVANVNNVTAKNLYDVKHSSLTNTISFYDVIRDQLLVSNYGAFEQEVLNAYKKEITIRKYKDRIKDLIK
ncbi:MAG: hypothetical protein FWD32_01350 [Firmicutes bacterium]|nr:hypothetical protein [Bacillota bacterium]